MTCCSSAMTYWPQQIWGFLRMLFRRRRKNPLFSGKMGVWDGILILNKVTGEVSGFGARKRHPWYERWARWLWYWPLRMVWRLQGAWEFRYGGPAHQAMAEEFERKEGFFARLGCKE